MMAKNIRMKISSMVGEEPVGQGAAGLPAAWKGAARQSRRFARQPPRLSRCVLPSQPEHGSRCSGWRDDAGADGAAFQQAGGK